MSCPSAKNSPGIKLAGVRRGSSFCAAPLLRRLRPTLAVAKSLGPTSEAPPKSFQLFGPLLVVPNKNPKWLRVPRASQKRAKKQGHVERAASPRSANLTGSKPKEIKVEIFRTNYLIRSLKVEKLGFEAVRNQTSLDLALAGLPRDLLFKGSSETALVAQKAYIEIGAA